MVILKHTMFDYVIEFNSELWGFQVSWESVRPAQSLGVSASSDTPVYRTFTGALFTTFLRPKK